MTDRRFGSMVMEDAGNGPPIVLIHGLGGDSNTFQTLLPTLSGFRVIRPDLPGAGRSPLRPGLDGLRGLTRAVTDGLKALGIGRAYLVGHSMGTLLCQYMAAAAPDRVSGMALFGPILEPPSAARQGLLARADDAQRAGMSGIADAVAGASVSDASDRDHPVTRVFVRESLMRQDPAGYAAHCRALAAAEPADHGRIACPVLLATGAADPVAPPAMAEALSHAIPNTRLEVVADAGHWMTIETPRRAADLLRAHLAEQYMEPG